MSFKRTCAFGIASVAVGGVAHAAAYDDFANALSAYERGEYATSIAGFTAAINAGDLAPNLKATAYLDRGQAYLFSGRCKEAATDVAAAKGVNANATEVAEMAAGADECLGDYGGAIALYTSLIATDAHWGYFWARGRARWESGDFAGAASDFRGVVSVKPDYAYPVVWLAMTDARLGKFDSTQLIRTAQALDLSEWPGPIVKFYLGQATQTDVDVSVQGDGRDVANRSCEANFYLGEWQLIQSNRTAAVPLLQSAVAGCPPSFVERDAAQAELTRLR